MDSSTTICTLFEGHYHHGVAALANSLHMAGFRGAIWVGFRGALPSWVPDATDGEPVVTIGGDVTLRFLRLTTQAHLTNYKPDFMLTVAARAPECQRLLYLDPDIVVRAPWSFMEEWIDSGVAAVEDINSPLDDSHPRRAAWRRFFASHGLVLKTRTPMYVNGGCLGVRREALGFLLLWQTILNHMSAAIGGLEAAPSSIAGAQMRAGQDHPGFCFNKTDQDALNVCFMAWEGAISVMGGDAMDFREGGYVMSHALGAPKPWAKAFLRDALRGCPPSRADKEFWSHASGPLRTQSTNRIWARRKAVAMASLVGRFYRRS